MSLDNFKEKFIIMNKSIVNLPIGIVITWTEGAEVMLSPSFDNSMQAREAMALGATLTGTIAIDLIYKGIIVFDTYLKWVSQGIYIRIGDFGIESPSFASDEMQMIQFGAEKIKILPS